jgi:restriction system protein
MARKQKSNFLEDSLTMASLMPWWAGLILALLSFLLLNSLANIEVPVSNNLSTSMSNLSIVVIKSFGSIFQYVVPVYFLFVSAYSLIDKIGR